MFNIRYGIEFMTEHVVFMGFACICYTASDVAMHCIISTQEKIIQHTSILFSTSNMFF